jgi:hypothetical protein
MTEGDVVKILAILIVAGLSYLIGLVHGADRYRDKIRGRR